MKNKKLLVVNIIVIIVLLIISGFVIYRISNKNNNKRILFNFVKSMNEVGDDNYLYVKIINSDVNVREYSHVSNTNKIGLVHINDVYKVNDIIVGDAYYWFYIEDSEGNRGYVASGRDVIYVETFIKNKDEQVVLSSISDYYDYNENTTTTTYTTNSQLEATNKRKLTIKYQLDYSVKSFLFYIATPYNNIFSVYEDGFLISPDKYNLTCKDSSSNVVNCNELNVNNDYSVIINIKYEGILRAKTVQLKGNGQSNNTNDTTTTTTPPTTSSTTTTATTTTIGKLSAKGNIRLISSCINSRCYYGIQFEIKASGGKTPYTSYSMTIYKDGVLIAQNINKSKYTIDHNKGTYIMAYTVHDSDNNYTSGSVEVTFG